MFIVEVSILGITAIVLGSLRLAKYALSLEEADIEAEIRIERLELDAKLKRESPPPDPVLRKEAFQRRREILQEQRRLWWNSYQVEIKNKLPKNSWEKVVEMDQKLEALAKEEAS